jgi:ubiquinone/menaquinone biosynthesis C-methylase UbiE
MEISKKQPKDWKPFNIANFWNWISQNPASQTEYFTSGVGIGLVRLLRKQKMLKGKVLDYGCGAGHLLNLMVDEPTGDYYGLDFSPDSIEATRHRTNNSSRIKELLWIENLPCDFNNNQFDSISFIETIEHLQDETLHATLDELYRILKPDGKILITTPFNESLNRNVTFCPFCKSEFHHMQHMQSFTIERMTALFQQHGFVIEYCKNLDLTKYQLGSFKYGTKKILLRVAASIGLKKLTENPTPNLVTIVSKK